MKVLILSSELWREDTNGGNVLSNLLADMNAEFAQIYCSPGIPKNNVCNHYFQITDFMNIRNLIKREKVGKSITFLKSTESIEVESFEKVNRSFYGFFRKFHWDIFDFAREVIWKLSNWKNDNLNNFVIQFNPDLIFAPCYASHYMLALTRHVADLTNVKVISYVSDDNYSLRQFRLSPIYWINRFILRENMRKTFPYYSLTYTMTEEQKSELENVLGANMKVLTKGGDFQNIPVKSKINCPIKIVYAGGIYCGRDKTLSYIGKVLKEINKDGVKIRLDIYTQTNLSATQRKQLNDGINIFVHEPVGKFELANIYQDSDIALHVESFELKYKLLTRLSFSTKIVDCLASSCAVMAISWREHSGLKYLAREDAAICIDKLDKIKECFVNVLNNNELIINYAQKANKCLQKNHDIKIIRNSLYSDFMFYANLRN